MTMSTEDRDWIKRMVPDSKVSIVANGIDVEYFKNTPIRRPKSPTVLFVGNYKWLPNVDAAKYIAYEIWPSIHRQIPNAELKIVGRDATNEILKLKRIPGVNVIGEVGDIREALGSAHVMLAPIRNGRGTRYKILEAMAAGLPVVSTSLGIEGIRAKDGVNALIRDSKEELVRATVELLKNPALTKKLAINGKRLVDNNFNWEKISGDLDVVYQKLGRLHEN